MSQEIVLGPVVVMGAAFPILAVGAIAGAAALGVKRLIDAEIEGARRKAAEARAGDEAWVHALERRNAEMAAASRRLEQAHAALTDLSAAGLAHASKGSVDGRASATGFVGLDNRSDQAFGADLVSEIERTIAVLPQVGSGGGATVEQLQRQGERLRWQAANGPLAWSTVAAFREAVRRTLAEQSARAKRQRRRQEEVVRVAERLIGEIATLRELAQGSPQTSELAALLARLRHAVETDTVRPAKVDLVARWLGELRKTVESELEHRCLNRWLAGRVTDHLADLGYESVQPFGSAGGVSHAVFRAPGGSEVSLALHPNHSLGAKFEEKASTDQLALWCSDARELLRRLTRDGVEYRVQFERGTPNKGLPLIVVESASDLFGPRAEESQRQPKGTGRETCR